MESSLNPEQKTAVTHGKGPLLIIAGAGTGKTTVITERIKYLILEKNIDPSKILALTFTEKAANEMEERIDIALPLGLPQIWISTFHAFCDKILRQEALHIGLNPAYKLSTQAQSVFFLKKNLFSLTLNYFRPLGNPTKFVQGILQHFSRLSDEDIRPEEYLEYARKIYNLQFTISNKNKGVAQVEGPRRAPATSRFGLSSRSNDLRVKPSDEGDERQDPLKLEAEKIMELANAYKAYSQLKEKAGVMDFADLISNTLKLFRLRPNILKEYQNQFEYILIDEFQDTNYAQNQLAILLAGKKQNITVVGDDDQAIYRWRGAALSNMIQFKKHFPTTKIVTLIRNYRSSSQILDSAYRLIQYNNPDRLEVKEKIDKRLVAENKQMGLPVELIIANRGEDEAEEISETIKQLVEKEKFEYKDIAILVRANDHAHSFMHTFDRHGLPYQFLGPGQLFHQEEIKDLIAYLKVLYNFEDSSSLYRILTMPVFGLPAQDIVALLSFAKKQQISLFEALGKADDAHILELSKEKIETVRELIAKHIEMIPKETGGQILYYFLEESGMLKNYLESKPTEDEIRAKNIAKFFEKLKEFESQNDDASVFAIVDWIDLSMEMGESPLASEIDISEARGISLLTVHSSKGLEFPVVFIVNLVNQRFPSRERKEQIPIPDTLVKEVLPIGDFHLQEERRLFYVAMTRAKKRLFLTLANFYGDGKRERKVSPFVPEVFGKDLANKLQKIKNPSKEQLSLLNIFPVQKDNPIVLHEEVQSPISYISYSQIQTFDLCPLHYKLKYILNIPSPQTPSQSFGVSVHSALRNFYLRVVEDEKVSIKDVEKILRENWDLEGYESKAHEQVAFMHAKEILEKYLESNLDLSNPPIALEVPFEFSINHTLKVGGRIDRIDRVSSTTLEIIDYKTGGLPKEKELAENLQLTIYGLAATEIRDPLFNRKPEEILLSLYYLEEGKKITTTRTREQLEKAKAQILQKAEAISKSDFRCSKTFACQNCEYKIMCHTL